MRPPRKLLTPSPRHLGWRCEGISWKHDTFTDTWTLNCYRFATMADLPAELLDLVFQEYKPIYDDTEPYDIAIYPAHLGPRYGWQRGYFRAVDELARMRLVCRVWYECITPYMLDTVLIPCTSDSMERRLKAAHWHPKLVKRLVLRGFAGFVWSPTKDGLECLAKVLGALTGLVHLEVHDPSAIFLRSDTNRQVIARTFKGVRVSTCGGVTKLGLWFVNQHSAQVFLPIMLEAFGDDGPANGWAEELEVRVRDDPEEWKFVMNMHIPMLSGVERLSLKNITATGVCQILRRIAVPITAPLHKPRPDLGNHNDGRGSRGEGVPSGSNPNRFPQYSRLPIAKATNPVNAVTPLKHLTLSSINSHPHWNYPTLAHPHIDLANVLSINSLSHLTSLRLDSMAPHHPLFRGISTPHAHNQNHGWQNSSRTPRTPQLPIAIINLCPHLRVFHFFVPYSHVKMRWLSQVPDRIEELGFLRYASGIPYEAERELIYPILDLLTLGRYVGLRNRDEVGGDGGDGDLGDDDDDEGGMISFQEGEGLYPQTGVAERRYSKEKRKLRTLVIRWNMRMWRLEELELLREVGLDNAIEIKEDQPPPLTLGMVTLD